MDNTNKTILETVKPNIQPEFGRVADVTRCFGIKRGTLYNLLSDGKIRGVLISVRGKKSGVRLFDMASIRDFIQSQFNQATIQRKDNCYELPQPRSSP